MEHTSSTRLRPGMTITGRVEAVALDGRGMFTVDGRRAYVLGALPGDLADVRIRRRRRGELHCEAVVVHEEGIPRRQPACVHVSECGGCRWQQWAIDDQRRLKREIVEHALAEGLPGAHVAVLPTLAVGPEYGYRNKMEFTFGSVPVRHSERGAGTTLGLHRAGRFDVTFDLTRCWLPSPRASEVVAWVRAWANRHGLPAYDSRTHEGLLRHLVVRESAATGEMMVSLVAMSRGVDGLDELATDLPAAMPQVASVLLGVNTRVGDTAIPEELALLAGRQTILERIASPAHGSRGIEVEISLRSFLQTNSFGAARLYDLVATQAELSGAERVLDLYCGAGLIGLWLAPSAREVVGLELVPEAVEDAERLRRRLDLEHVRFVAGVAEEVLPRWAEAGDTFDVIVADPPRAGMHPKAVAALIELAPARVVYVSCNPRALAADMKELIAAGYVAGPVQPADMFPQTAHVESVVRLDRRRLDRRRLGATSLGSTE